MSLRSIMRRQVGRVENPGLGTTLLTQIFTGYASLILKAKKMKINFTKTLSMHAMIKQINDLSPLKK